MKEQEWLCFEKSGRVSDYLTYCQSSAGKFCEYGTKDLERCERQDGADLYPDRDDLKVRSCGRVR